MLHVSDRDGMAWGSIDTGVAGDSVWLDRSWDGGASWQGLLGRGAPNQLDWRTQASGLNAVIA